MGRCSAPAKPFPTTRRSVRSMPAANRPHHRFECRRDLQLLIGPVGEKGRQQTVAVAVNAEHDIAEIALQQNDLAGLLRQCRRSHGRGTNGTTAAIDLTSGDGPRAIGCVLRSVPEAVPRSAHWQGFHQPARLDRWVCSAQLLQRPSPTAAWSLDPGSSEHPLIVDQQ